VDAVLARVREELGAADAGAVGGFFDGEVVLAEQADDAQLLGDGLGYRLGDGFQVCWRRRRVC
jgi:hypothetical protein